ncbi:hypothetical protein SAMN05428961_11099 [Paenibacillus sp. OK060]|uniref:hypothetical protein n=1 Tax=Paenibacillus sp. OK060 TaxID=1881034 RepID=UPI0008895A7A|nr:hypothetical protein [Paenibacillus sp. OK060]SDM15673.1 hypothetical protein SAMN05428961_11099 [Paenibacillus sp. OK060]
MRFQKSIISVMAVLSIALASGCGQESKNTNVSQEEVSNGSESTQDATGSTNTSADKIGSKTILYNKEFSQKEPDLSTFKEGVSIDLSEHVKDFFTQDIADKVQNNMKAIVQHDETKFKENMLDEDSIKVNMDWFNYKYEDGVKFEFNELNGITYDEDAKRIQVIVTFSRNIKEQIEQGVMTYSLLEDKDSGTWLIATMDGN